MMNRVMGSECNLEDWHEWFAEWGDRFLLFARQQAGSFPDGEDVLQEAMVQIWSRRDRFPRIEPGLVFTQIRRCAVDHARKRQRRAAREQAYAREKEYHYFISNGTFDAGILQEALDALTPEQQEVLVLKIWGEQTFEVIGQTLEISPNTAASRYRYGLEQLRKKLCPEEIQ